MASGHAQRVGRTIVGRWEYTGNPATNNRDRCRWYLGDTDAEDPLVSDEEIAAALTDEGSNVRRAAAQCAEHLAAYFSREADKSYDDYRVSLSQRASSFLTLSNRLRDRSTISLVAAPWAGGISQSDKESRAADTDRELPAFTMRQFDYPGASDS